MINSSEEKSEYFNSTANLVEFCKENEKVITDKYNAFISAERNLDDFRRKSYAYCAIKECVFEKGLTATDCQYNKMAELVVFGLSLENMDQAI